MTDINELSQNTRLALGSLWRIKVGTTSDVMRASPIQQFELESASEGLTELEARGLAVQRDGRLWQLTDEGCDLAPDAGF